MREEVILASKLAKIRLTDEETNWLAREFEGAFKDNEAIRGVNTDAATPLAHGVEGVHCRLREDISSAPFGRDRLLANAPDAQDGCFAVPRILE